MGVEEVYKFLKFHKGFHSIQEIADAIKLNVKSIKKSIKITERYNDIVCEYAHLQRSRAYKSAGLKMKKAWVYAHVNQIKNGTKTQDS